MNKYKILCIFTAMCLLISNSAYCENQKTVPKEKAGSGKLQGNIFDEEKEKNQDWWAGFKDSILKGYIDKAAVDAFDIKTAALKVSETEALVSEAFGKEFPLLNLDLNYLRNRTSDNVSMGSVRQNSYSQSSYKFPLNVSYELDLWRKNREKTVQKTKGLEAVKYEQKAVYISLTSAVASTYFNVINTEKQISLQKNIIGVRKEILDLTKINYDAGLDVATDVTLAKKSLSDAESAINDLNKQHSIFLNKLSVLIGESSGDSASLKRSSIDEVEIPAQIPEKIKDEVVKNRPDILKAEAELQKAKIDINLARKDFFPNIILSGQFGFNANSFSKTFDWQSYILSGGVGIAETIFSGGQRRARLKAKKYQYEEMLQSYQKTILTSFQEVNDSLAMLKYDSQKNSDNLNRIDHEKDYSESMDIKYKTGAISYLDTLQYKERVLSLEKEQIQSKTDCLTDVLTLYKATGGKI